ncbi:MAG: chemotaxis protein [Deltaproteobacteria bacterium]|nr:chemotaxis protein [Deltaproteobacteria bacterium]
MGLVGIALAVVVGILLQDRQAGLVPWLIAGVGVVGAFFVVLAASANVGADQLVESARRASEGERPPRPPSLSADHSALLDVLDRVAETIARRGSEAARTREELTRTTTERDRARDDLAKASAELERLRARVDALARERDTMRAEIDGSSAVLLGDVERLERGLTEPAEAAERTARTAQTQLGLVTSLAQQIEGLGGAATESSSAIAEVTASNEEVAETVSGLALQVRETIASIEHMAASIKEVARNADALALTAEETSSSMNQMDVSIDQVQSNANETARLSEEVAQDAERGAEAILKTIAEINRIKESASETVQIISNLGTRIEAIGDILDVIDDVAEQTNLLALNAAIIAAQAGEHGKSFAVVADEIKDLAERTGASTKEIATLVKSIQNESRGAMATVQRSEKNVDRGVEVSNEAERALKKILTSSQKSTNMVRTIARATVEQAKGSKQVTDAIGRIAETVQQIAAATGEQARGSELLTQGAEKMRAMTQQVERSAQDQARSGRQAAHASESIGRLLGQLADLQRAQLRESEELQTSSRRLDEGVRRLQALVTALASSSDRLRRAGPTPTAG